MSSQMATAERLDLQRGVQTEPLTEHDIQMIHRYFSDPTVFPREFKRWVTDHSSDTVDIAKTQVHGLVNSTGQVVIGSASMEMLGGVLVGCVIPYPGDAPPAGWFLCDGHEELKAPISVLAGMLGTRWGTPSSGDKVVIPDFRRRLLLGAGSGIPLGTTDGLGEGSRHIVHRHTVNDPSHSHKIKKPVNEGGQISTIQFYGESIDAPGNSQETHPASTGITVGPQWAPLDGPAYATLNYIIGSGRVPS